MKRQIKKWALRFTATFALIIGLLLTIVLNPSLTYANRTTHGNFVVYSQYPTGSQFFPVLDSAAALIKKSEWYRPNLKLDICLNDGSAYPKIMAQLRGRAFAWGFYDKVVLQGSANYAGNRLALNGYEWNLTQLLAHEMVHCVQFDRLGLMHSNPMAGIPNWKWEGYAEFIARQDASQQDLCTNIQRYIVSDSYSWAIAMADGSIAPRDYYHAWIMVQYCLAVKGQSYEQLLADRKSEEDIKKEMMAWYKGRPMRR
jgi:hypothetical protein